MAASEEGSGFFSVNILIIKQSMLLTFLWQLGIISTSDLKHKKKNKKKTTEFIHKFFRELTTGL